MSRDHGTQLRLVLVDLDVVTIGKLYLLHLLGAKYFSHDIHPVFSGIVGI